MADSAFQTQYRAEFIAGFEQRQSLVRDSTTTEAVISGNTATFLVADSGGATAKTRGVNGLIPARSDNLTQLSATLAEWHDLSRVTRFNIFASQGNRRAIMQNTTQAVMNRKIDSDIITELGNATVTTGAAVTAGMQLITRSKTKLGNAGVPWDSNIWALITPAFEGYLLQLKEFNSREYTNKMSMDSADQAWRDKVQGYFWLGINWIVHPNLSGAGTASETCFLYHKSAIGHAMNSDGLMTPVGYDEEQDYSWARATCDMGPKLLQNSGVVKMIHDGSALA